MSDNKERDELIEEIEWLYPPDSHDDGRELLIDALCKAWRGLPIGVLRELRNLNVQKDHSKL